MPSANTYRAQQRQRKRHIALDNFSANDEGSHHIGIDYCDITTIDYQFIIDDSVPLARERSERRHSQPRRNYRRLFRYRTCSIYQRRDAANDSI